MLFELLNGIAVLKFDALWTTTLAIILLLIGFAIRNKVGIIGRFCIPAPVIGGLLMSITTLILHHTGNFTVQFTTSMQSPMMLAFFTTVGVGGSFGLLKKGGRALIIYLVFCWVLAAIQNAFGAGLASALGLNPLLGIMAGAVSLEGGHGAAAAFGPMVEGLGVKGAAAVAIASATFGLIAGGLLGGPVAKTLIERHHLKIEANTDTMFQKSADDILNEQSERKVTSAALLSTLALVLILMVIGSYLSQYIARLTAGTNFSLPGYVTAMFAAVVFRNLNDHLHFVKINSSCIDIISDISVGIFLTMAMMSLRIWDLYDLALPLIVILMLQTTLIVLLAMFVLFRLLGRDYDAVVMCSGFIGHGLGATPNAVANMGSVCERYGVMSYKAFLIVPLCGAVLIDLVGIPNIVWFINFFANR